MIHHYDLQGGVPVTCEHSMMSTGKNVRRSSGKRMDASSLACTRIDLAVPADRADVGVKKREVIAEQLIKIAGKQGITLPPFRKLESQCPKEGELTYSLLLNDCKGTLLPLVQAALQQLS